MDDLPPALLDNAPPTRFNLTASAEEPWTPMTLEDALREPERRILTRALDANAWTRQKTADQLGINRTTLYKNMKQHGLLGDGHIAG